MTEGQRFCVGFLAPPAMIGFISGNFWFASLFPVESTAWWIANLWWPVLLFCGASGLVFAIGGPTFPPPPDFETFMRQRKPTEFV